MTIEMHITITLVLVPFIPSRYLGSFGALGPEYTCVLHVVVTHALYRKGVSKHPKGFSSAQAGSTVMLVRHIVGLPGLGFEDCEL